MANMPCSFGYRLQAPTPFESPSSYLNFAYFCAIYNILVHPTNPITDSIISLYITTCNMMFEQEAIQVLHHHQHRINQINKWYVSLFRLQTKLAGWLVMTKVRLLYPLGSLLLYMVQIKGCCASLHDCTMMDCE